MSEKRKRKRTSKPIKKYLSPFNHMVGWGMLTGYVLAWAIYVTLIQANFMMMPFDIILALLILSPIWLITGSLPGAIMGLFTGAVVNIFVEETTCPNDFTVIQYAQKRSSTVVFTVSSLMTFLLVSALASSLEFSGSSMWLFIVGFAISAGLGMTLASYHYFSRLYRWSVKAYGDIEKPKHTLERLSADETQDDGILEDANITTHQQHDHR